MSEKRLQKIADRLSRAPHNVSLRRLKACCEAFGRWEEGSSHAVVMIEGSHPITVPRHRMVREYVVRQVVAAMEVYLVSPAEEREKRRHEGEGGESDD